MNANPSVRAARIPSGVAPLLMVVLLAAAFLLGGTGGYLVRDLNFSWPASTVNTVTTKDTTQRPFVFASPPVYASPASPAQQDSKRATE